MMKNWTKLFLAEANKSIWPIIGLFATWLVLTGSAKKIFGIIFLISIIIWILTLKIRSDDGQK